MVKHALILPLCNTVFLTLHIITLLQNSCTFYPEKLITSDNFKPDLYSYNKTSDFSKVLRCSLSVKFPLPFAKRNFLHQSNMTFSTKKVRKAL